MVHCADRQHRSRVVKPSRSRDKPFNQSSGSEDDLNGRANASLEVALTPEERERLLAELEAELEVAERSIEEEGIIAAEEFVRQRADYWAGSTESSGERDGKAARR